MQNYEKRLQSLQNRREILISANSINHYTQTGNEKIEKYYSVLLNIKKQIAICYYALNAQINQTGGFLKSTSGLNGSQILLLNSK
jgi:hypothetical protein